MTLHGSWYPQPVDSLRSQSRMTSPTSPHKICRFLLTWPNKQGIDGALIQPYSGHASRQSLEVYSRLALKDAQAVYELSMKNFPV